MLAAVSVDWRVLLLSAVVTLAIGLAFGIAPALLATRVDPEGALRVSGAGSTNRASVAMRQTLDRQRDIVLVLVIDAVDRQAFRLGERVEDRGLDRARRAPRRKNIDQADMPLQIGREGRAREGRSVDVQSTARTSTNRA